MPLSFVVESGPGGYDDYVENNPSVLQDPNAPNLPAKPKPHAPPPPPPPKKQQDEGHVPSPFPFDDKLGFVIPPGEYPEIFGDFVQGKVPPEMLEKIAFAAKQGNVTFMGTNGKDVQDTDPDVDTYVDERFGDI